jgi:NAD(P)-dependent dehydrogenase (short-subunit alcohol dehydrogenase family)
MTRPVVLIAGGSRGIGAATARLAAAEGYDVAVNYKSNANAAASVIGAVKATGGNSIAIAGDMAIEADIQNVFDTAARELGPVTHFVHSSGIIGKFSRIDEAAAATIQEVFAVNIFGAMICLRECIRRMSTKHGGKGGSIVMLSSIAAVLGAPGEFVWYAASKGAIDAMVIGAAREVGKEGIRINAVSPGLIDTDIQGPGRIDRLGATVPVGRAGEASEVADAILYLLSERASYVTGANLRVSGAR